ncbi:HIT family protein [Notoacmeibacter sp. MSK16QG-6]|uniref:HIT family protein n=1 Tax=Notoacmeibacter sp. MSK16QG-6 TaxID=2957982 RepID=UPI0020A1B7A3|nr:HIT family protein [Notoacmeibacter sp. MSK16QG-6]MCP1199311.1 HIT family protein [Notoacmeibacter sp. MSK16QG-6]
MLETATAYDDNNIFAKILRGEMPANQVYEDEHCIVIMDVMPSADGHCLVVPKSPSRNLLDAAPDVLAHLIAVTQKIARAAKQAFEADGVRISQFNEAAAGQTVMHLHIHIIPVKEGVGLRRHAEEMADADLLKEHAAKLRSALADS